jgi:xanthine dehydrogenase accessory factor
MDQQLLSAIEIELQAGSVCLLATVVERFGSAPRGTGTGMVVSQRGEQTGTLGGGSMEFFAREDAKQVLLTGANAIKAYDIHTDDSGKSSGSVQILFRTLNGDGGRALCERMRQAFAAQQEAYLVCELSEKSGVKSRVLTKEQLCSICNLSCPPVRAICCESENRYLIEPLLPAPRVVLFGGGHVAQCMVRQLDLLDYRIWVVEDRAEFARAALFPAAERVLFCDYAQADGQIAITKRDHAIIMSRGHETDEQILRWLLHTEADYIGCIGSRKKIALLKEKLLLDGLNEKQIGRLHAPIGLPIGAQTPAEIAVSVAAELISYSACKQ